MTSDLVTKHYLEMQGAHCMVATHPTAMHACAAAEAATSFLHTPPVHRPKRRCSNHLVLVCARHLSFFTPYHSRRFERAVERHACCLNCQLKKKARSQHTLTYREHSICAAIQIRFDLKPLGIVDFIVVITCHTSRVAAVGDW